MKELIHYNPIGVIHTAYDNLEGMPIQSHLAGSVPATVEVEEDFMPGLMDLDGFSHIILLYHLHRVKGYKLYVVPFMDDKPHGIFATRAPVRPNPIGLSIVRLTKVEGNLIFVEGADMLDKTPLLDIKPFFSWFDNQSGVVSGWLEGKEDKDFQTIRSDKRFDDIQKPGINRCK